MEKLAEFNAFAGHLPPTFFCGPVFFELDAALATDQTILPNLLPSQPVLGYWGGLIIHCALDDEMSGLMLLITLPEKKEDALGFSGPIAKSIEDLNIYRAKNGDVKVKGQGAGVMAFAGPDKQWHFSKQYSSIIYGKHCGLSLSWSHNGFARFALNVLSRLEGRSAKDTSYLFGQVFDSVD